MAGDEAVSALELGTRLKTVDGRNEETGDGLARMLPPRGALRVEVDRRELNWAGRAYFRVVTEAVAEEEPGLKGGGRQGVIRW